MKVKVGDTVKIIAGADKGKEGKVIRTLKTEQRVVVEGINIVKKHSKPRMTNESGSIIEIEAPIHVSNVKVITEAEAKEIKKEAKKAEKKEKVEEKVEKTVEVETPSEEKKEVVETNDLSALTLTDLKAKAKEAGIKGYSTMKKAEIIAALEK